MLLKELCGLISSAERASCRFLSSDAKADSIMEYLLDDADNHQLLFVMPATYVEHSCKFRDWWKIS